MEPNITNDMNRIANALEEILALYKDGAAPGSPATAGKPGRKVNPERTALLQKLTELGAEADPKWTLKRLKEELIRATAPPEEAAGPPPAPAPVAPAPPAPAPAPVVAVGPPADPLGFLDPTPPAPAAPAATCTEEQLRAKILEASQAGVDKASLVVAVQQGGECSGMSELKPEKFLAVHDKVVELMAAAQ